MEGGGGGRKPTTTTTDYSSSSSSISNQLFGSKGGSSTTNANSSSSKGIFDSVFATPSSYQGSEMSGSWRRNDYEHWNPKQESQGNNTQCSKGESHDINNKDHSSIFQDDRVEPCYLSSSIYYGGQDVYSDPSKPRSSPSQNLFKKDGEDDDPNRSNMNSASRGNWWQGSLYY